MVIESAMRIDENLKQFWIEKNVGREVSCHIVHKFNYSDRCAFVKAVENCQISFSYVNYMNFFFCTFDPRSVFMYVFYLTCFLVWFILLFVFLSYSVWIVLIPSLKVVCTECHINQHLAGALLLALGGGAPGLINTIASILRKTDIPGFSSNIFATILFETIFIGGLIIVICPFDMHPINTIRDAAFVLFSVLFIDFAIRTDKCISLKEWLFILGIYVTYLVILVIDQIMLKGKLKGEVAKMETSGRGKTYVKSLRDELMFPIPITSSVIITNRIGMINLDNRRDAGLFSQFFASLNPLDLKTFREASTFQKLNLLLSIPMKLIILILLPIVDYEKPRHGWSKLLNCFQIIYLPAIMVFSTWGTTKINGFPIWVTPFFVTAPIAILLSFSTRADIPPRWHFILGFLTGAGVMIVLYSCAVEIMEMFKVLGVVLNCSADFLAITIMCWGVGIADLIGNVSMALSGYERMGYAACYGSAMFTSVVLVVVNFLSIAMTKLKDCYEIFISSTDEICVCFSILGLLFTIAFLFILNCRARRCFGLFSLAFYLLFVIYALLSELSIIHSYSDDQLFFAIP